MSGPAARQSVRPQRLLVISAHPADADARAGGSVAGWISQGTVAHLVCCTSGDGEADDAMTDPLRLASTREVEQRAAASIIGYEAVTFLHRPDGAVANDLALREQLVRIIRSFRPDSLAAPDPRTLVGKGHIEPIDDRQAGAAALDAVYPAARNAMAFPHLVRSEGLEPHEVRRVFLFGSAEPDTWIDVGRSLETQLAALRAHASQLHRLAGLEAVVRERAQEVGRGMGVDAAEAFFVVELA